MSLVYRAFSLTEFKKLLSFSFIWNKSVEYFFTTFFAFIIFVNEVSLFDHCQILVLFHKKPCLVCFIATQSGHTGLII
jgi:hypothetical protein